MDESNSMNFANLLLMLYNCCGSEFHDEITGKENLRLLFDILNSMNQFVDSSSIFSTDPLLIDLKPEDFQASSWVPEMSLDELNRLEELLVENYTKDQELRKLVHCVRFETDVEKVQEAKLQAQAYINRLKRDRAFFRDVVQSFLPLEITTNSLNCFLNQVEETLTNINKLLRAIGEPENQLSTEGQTHQKHPQKEAYYASERNFIERYDKLVDMGRIEGRINSAMDQKQLENIRVEILPLISNIEEEYQALIDSSNRENTVKSLRVTQIFNCSQQIKKKLNDLSKTVESVNHHVQPSTVAQTRQQLSGREIYFALEGRFLEQYGEWLDIGEIEARIDSATDQKQLEIVKIEILPVISNIEKEYRALIDLSKREYVVKSAKLKRIFESSQRIKKQIIDLSKAFSEVEPENHHLQPPTVVKTPSSSKNETFPSTSETKTLSSEKVFYSNGFLQTCMNLALMLNYYRSKEAPGVSELTTMAISLSHMQIS
ncbi:hypothetical protein Aperf_G00000048523 [Anoplocephala perfoliata]